MGFIKNHTIVVTGYGHYVKGAHKYAKSVFKEAFPDHSLVSSLVLHAINGDHSFFIAPDGSKEGWSDSDIGDHCRELVVKYLKDHYVDFVEVSFGGDEPSKAKILNFNK